MNTQTPNLFASPEDAEAAFYEAFAKGDVDAMMAVWAEDEEIACTHPGGARLVGHAAVRAGWLALLQGGGRLRMQLSHEVRWRSGMMAVHHVVETVEGADGASALVATNVYMRGADGWKMLLHHASPVSTLAESAEVPRILH